MAGNGNNTRRVGGSSGRHPPQDTCEPCRSFGQKCSHLVKKQRAKFYILRRCIAMLICWHERERGDS